eukprot:scaffold10570_cov176-Amphora_coffeaeformis.AAC.34
MIQRSLCHDDGMGQISDGSVPTRGIQIHHQRKQHESEEQKNSEVSPGTRYVTLREYPNASIVVSNPS